MSGKSVPPTETDDRAVIGLEMAEVFEPAAQTSFSSALTVGQQLRATREAKGLSVVDVARTLKLSHRQVESLETDDWSSLPCTTIIRGFVRNYARLLDLDPDALMVALDRLKMPQVPELEMSVGTPVSIPQENRVDRRDFVRIFSGLIVLLLALMLYFLVPQDLWQSSLSALRAATQSNEVVDETAVPSEADETKAAEAPQTPLASVSPPEPTVTPEVEVAVPSLPIQSASSESLKFNFTKPAWVEVRDRNGQIIYSQLGPEGSQREVQGQPPFSLVIGNSTYVTLQYKGNAVVFSKRSKDDVARLTLE